MRRFTTSILLASILMLLAPCYGDTIDPGGLTSGDVSNIVVDTLGSLTGTVIVTSIDTQRWNEAYSWGNHTGLYATVAQGMLADNALSSNQWTTADSTTNYLPRTGGTMSGDIDMGGGVITNAGQVYANTNYADKIVARVFHMPSEPEGYPLIVLNGSDSAIYDETGQYKLLDMSYAAAALNDNAGIKIIDLIYHQIMWSDGVTAAIDLSSGNESLLNLTGQKWYDPNGSNGEGLYYTDSNPLLTWPSASSALYWEGTAAKAIDLAQGQYLYWDGSTMMINVQSGSEALYDAGGVELLGLQTTGYRGLMYGNASVAFDTLTGQEAIYYPTTTKAIELAGGAESLYYGSGNKAFDLALGTEGIYFDDGITKAIDLVTGQMAINNSAGTKVIDLGTAQTAIIAGDGSSVLLDLDPGEEALNDSGGTKLIDLVTRQIMWNNGTSVAIDFSSDQEAIYFKDGLTKVIDLVTASEAINGTSGTKMIDLVTSNATFGAVSLHGNLDMGGNSITNIADGSLAFADGTSFGSADVVAWNAATGATASAENAWTNAPLYEAASTADVQLAWSDSFNEYTWAGDGDKRYLLPTCDTTLRRAQFSFNITTTNILYVVADDGAVIDGSSPGGYVYSGSGGTNQYTYARVVVGLVETNEWRLFGGRREWTGVIYP